MADAPHITIDFAVSQEAREQPARYIIPYRGKQATLELPVMIPKGEEGASIDPDQFHRPLLEEFLRELSKGLTSRIRWRQRDLR